MAAREPVPRDGCVVPAEPIRELISSFVAGWHRDRPASTSTQFGLGPGDVQPVPPLEWLSHEASRRSRYPIKESTLSNLLTVSGGEARREVVELRVADAILLALDRPDIAFGPDGIPVLPNPRATAGARAECCSGAGPMTGSAAPPRR